MTKAMVSKVKASILKKTAENPGDLQVKSSCRSCGTHTITEKQDLCGTCYPKGGQTNFCYVCHRCKRCGKDRDPKVHGFELPNPDSVGLTDQEGNPLFVGS